MVNKIITNTLQEQFNKLNHNDECTCKSKDGNIWRVKKSMNPSGVECFESKYMYHYLYSDSTNRMSDIVEIKDYK